MPTVITHALTGLVLGHGVYRERMPWRFRAWTALLPIVPDFDVIAFRLGIPYEHFFGHRGFFHSICFALVLATLPMWELRGHVRGRGERVRMVLFFFVIAASHGLMDAATDGGLGIALLSPFDTTRYFFPWTPILVSPIGLKYFLSRWGYDVMVSEALWVWLPLGVVFVIVRLAARGRKASAVGVQGAE